MKNPHKGSILLLITIAAAVLILALIGGGIYLIGKSHTNGWKTYTDSYYGIQFKYPNDWQVTDQNSDVVIVRVVDSTHKPKPDSDQSANYFLVRTIGDLDLNHLQAGTLRTDSGWTTGFAGFPWRVVYNQSKNINIIMSAMDSSAQRVEEQILSTVVYTNSKDYSADWKTYVDIQSGFSISYPGWWESPFKHWSGGWTAGTWVDNENFCVIDFSVNPDSNQWEITDLLSKGYLKTSTQIDGINAIRLTRNPSGAGLTEAVYFSRNGLNLRIGRNRGSGSTIESQCISTFNQVLGSAKFTK